MRLSCCTMVRIGFTRSEEDSMSKIVKGALVVIGIGAVACAIAHRRVIAACVKGEPLPEAPEWHKQCGIHKD